MSGVLLVGLVANSLLGWSWADPIAALLIAAIAVKEGYSAWRGDGCCAPNAAALSQEVTNGSSDACSCCSH